MNLTRPCWTLALLAGCSPALHAQSATVAIFHCTDPQGYVTVRDTPCGKGQTQAESRMLKPHDAPAQSAPVVVRPVPHPQQRQASVWQGPAPALFACTPPDGETYFNETGEGLLRWQPLVSVWPAAVSGVQATAYARSRAGMITGRLGMPVVNAVPVVSGTWVRDTCEPVARDEQCELLTSRRDALQQQNTQRQPSEARKLESQIAALEARRQQVCIQ